MRTFEAAEQEVEEARGSSALETSKETASILKRQKGQQLILTLSAVNPCGWKQHVGVHCTLGVGEVS